MSQESTCSKGVQNGQKRWKRWRSRVGRGGWRNRGRKEGGEWHEGQVIHEKLVKLVRMVRLALLVQVQGLVPKSELALD